MPHFKALRIIYAVKKVAEYSSGWNYVNTVGQIWVAEPVGDYFNRG